MNKMLVVALGAALVVLLVLFSVTYTVSYHEVAIKTRFGKTDESSIVREPGLKFRLPFFADNVVHLDKRLQLRESPLKTVRTADQLEVMVKAYMLWKVDDEDPTGQGPLRFRQHYETIDGANQNLLDTFQNAVNTGVSKARFDDLIGPNSQVEKAEDAIAAEMRLATKDNGIKTVVVGISQIMLTPKTSTSVLNRMVATNKTISDTERIKGTSQAEGIKNRASNVAAKIESFARTRAEDIRQAGSLEAARFLKTMSQDQDLASFLTWLDALQTSLSENSTVVIPTAFAPFHLMLPNGKVDAHGIPQPGSAMAPASATGAGDEAAPPTVSATNAAAESAKSQNPKEGR